MYLYTHIIYYTYILAYINNAYQLDYDKIEEKY